MKDRVVFVVLIIGLGAILSTLYFFRHPLTFLFCMFFLIVWMYPFLFWLEDELGLGLSPPLLYKCSHCGKTFKEPDTEIRVVVPPVNRYVGVCPFCKSENIEVIQRR
ncbi:MAG TPA: hypothetical protein ENG66_05260 [Thermococcus sp.]|nr:hypothetical protein [Thermococcus sp.]